jgi:hypothetical protein
MAALTLYFLDRFKSIGLFIRLFLIMGKSYFFLKKDGILGISAKKRKQLQKLITLELS